MFILQKFKKITLIIILLNSVSCSSTDENKQQSEIGEDKIIYKEAIKYTKQNKYKEAIKKFKKINDDFPFSKFSSDSKIYNAYLNYELNNHDETIRLLSDYIYMNPTGEFIDYAYYMMGMTYYVQISDPDRDSEFTKKAVENFENLINSFPSSVYSKDAKLKKDLLYNYLAKKEFNIAMFYLKKNVPSPAINRFSFILKNYDGTAIIPQTLYRIAEAFLMIGLKDEAKKSLEILRYNFPNNIWSDEASTMLNEKKNKDEDKSFFDKIF